MKSGCEELSGCDSTTGDHSLSSNSVQLSEYVSGYSGNKTNALYSGLCDLSQTNGIDENTHDYKNSKLERAKNMNQSLIAPKAETPLGTNSFGLDSCGYENFGRATPEEGKSSSFSHRDLSRWSTTSKPDADTKYSRRFSTGSTVSGDVLSNYRLEESKNRSINEVKIIFTLGVIYFFNSF